MSYIVGDCSLYFFIFCANHAYYGVVFIFVISRSIYLHDKYIDGDDVEQVVNSIKQKLSINQQYKNRYIRTQNLAMKIQTIILYSILIVQLTSKCTDQLSCFKNKLFNFGSPGENIYLINQITNNNSSSTSNVLAYGDFNNDLHTDYVVQGIGNGESVSLYFWDTDTQLFMYNQTINCTQCPVTSVFLYDIDLNGLLDIVIWGTINNQNCLQPFIHQTNNTYIASQLLTMEPTSDPIVISFGPDNLEKTIGLLVYMNGSRAILKYESTNNNFNTIGWANLFNSTTNFVSMPFANPHWNSFLDVTGDCQSDVIIVNAENNIQIWTYYQKIFIYQGSLNFPNINSLSFADMNYNGVIDMIVANNNAINVYFNTRALKDQVDFCNSDYTNVSFNINPTLTLSFPDNYIMATNTLQLKDINIDGYPDILLPLTIPNTQISTVSIYLNYEAQSFGTNNQYKLPTQNFTNIISASFIDFWENGIMDIIVCTQQNGINSFYNNYLQQNLFFIKAYGANGATSTGGAQIVGASFYWVNSVGDRYRTTYQPQIIQTAYNALQTPYSYCGLGRANNYVESFTLGMYGQSSEWSPIIPNSQLAVYTQGIPSQWKIRIYVLPNQSLIYVVIVSVAVLTLLGLVLVGLKCKNYRKKDEPLMQFIH